MTGFLRGGLTLFGIALFVGVLWWGARAQTRVECRLCIEFKGRTECRAGQGEDEQAAVMSASTNACAFLANGVTESFQCGAMPAASKVCREL